MTLLIMEDFWPTKWQLHKIQPKYCVLICNKAFLKALQG